MSWSVKMMIHLEKRILETAKHFGTPLFLYDLNVIQEKYQMIRKNLTRHCDIFYSLKANPNLSVCEYIHQLGANCEISSKNELLIALKAGFRNHQIIFVGPGKTSDDIAAAIQYKIKAIVCESLYELYEINRIAKLQKQKADVWIRINPDFCANAAPIKMSGVASQFGIMVDEFKKNIRQIKECHHIQLTGLHIYNASRILNAEAITENIGNILNLAESLSTLFRISLKYVDFGGGFGIPYFENESELPTHKLLHNINVLIHQYLLRMPKTRFILEMGRFLVADSGCLVSRVIHVKESHQKKYIILDSGMHCCFAATGLGSFVHRNFPSKIISEQKQYDLHFYEYQVAGSLCTPGDLLLKNVKMQRVFQD